MMGAAVAAKMRPIIFTPENVRKILDGTKGRGDRGDPRHLAKGHDGVP